MKIHWHQNPLRTVVELDDSEKEMLRRCVRREILEDTSSLLEIDYDEVEASAFYPHDVERMYHYYLTALHDEHHGDCVKHCCTCTKCWAEDFMGVDTLVGSDSNIRYNLRFAFEKVNKIDDALAILKDRSPESYEWLLHYKRTRLT